VKGKVKLEIVGYQRSECSPFPCDENRTCGLINCAPTGELVTAYDALKVMVEKKFPNKTDMILTLIDKEVPEYIKDIYEHEHPAIPMVLINGNVIPVGRISWPHIRDAIYKELTLSDINC
jgi:hypothetical protein